MPTRNNENNIVITTGMNGGDVVVTAILATFMMIAGALAYAVIRQMENSGEHIQDSSIQYSSMPYNVSSFGENDFVPPVMINAPTNVATHDIKITQETHETELSPVTFLGYNTTNDLVGVMKRMPNGEVMHRKIRDPEMSLDNLEVDRWVEFNDWKKENDYNWI